MIFLKNKNLQTYDIDGYLLRGKSFYNSIVEYRSKILRKFKYRIQSKKEHNCLLCRSNKTKLLLKWKSDYSIFQCLQCGASSPNIKLEKRDNHTTSVYENETYNEKFIREIHNQFKYRKETFGQERYFYAKKFIPKKKNPYILDLGCGAGYFLSVLKDRKIKSKGLEVSSHLVSYCKRNGLNVSSSNIELERDSSFDLITMYDVLEHLENPIEVMSSINKKLKKNGICIAYTPNIESLAFELMGSNQNTLLPFEHVCFYNPKSLNFLATKSGFDVISIETRGLDLLDYFFWKEYQYNDTYIDKFNDLIKIGQAIIDNQSASNHFRIVFRKKAIK